MMAKRGSMVMENPDTLTAGIRALSAAMTEETLRRAALAGARVFLAEEKLRVPVLSGKGRDNLIIAYDKEVSTAGVIASYIVTWSKEAFYLRFIEYGSSHAAAKPFKRPAFEAKKNAAAQAVDDVLNAVIQGVPGGK
ncbi:MULTISPECIES: HK97-gp10 family putative phage morphogenesis protein [Burkholderia]|uniref:HK97 gp10 family phage protein n=2 Tax=Burkholderiaceae TaxID=119060 RepID=A0ABY5B6T3_BURGL|nr:MULTISPECIES: HK97-gp10 family putative phage morphogenesis protein [Burkholderia]MCR1769060.1 HK97 gp10 family phage protein [Burkholderia glumae]USS42752.1 HK97 gp10 family phage protein [Burkholderia glumae]